MNKLIIRLICLIVISIQSCCNNPTKSPTELESIKLESARINEHQFDTIIIHDTIYIKSHPEIIKEVVTQIVPEWPVLDSINTEKELYNILSYGNVIWESVIGDLIPGLSYGRNDLEILPYYIVLFSDNILPKGNYDYLQDMSYLCSSINDASLYRLGKQIFENIKESVPHKYGKYVSEYPDKSQKYIISNDKIDKTDSLRIRIIAHNDRSALKSLEEYYKNKGDDKGIAVYYKVMLSYDGNGDLAERFYKVLEPYFDETPEFRKAVREVLLRAAHCDNDRRAQELCDSLGFSLCDYRLTLPVENN